jgi:LPXTG-motif cell wall-anchored protein
VYAVGSLEGKTLHTLAQSIPVSTTPAPTSAPAPAPPTGGQLPETGSSTGLLVAIGLGILAAGVIVTRRFATR